MSCLKSKSSHVSMFLKNSRTAAWTTRDPATCPGSPSAPTAQRQPMTAPSVSEPQTISNVYYWVRLVVTEIVVPLCLFSILFCLKNLLLVFKIEFISHPFLGTAYLKHPLKEQLLPSNFYHFVLSLCLQVCLWCLLGT